MAEIAAQLSLIPSGLASDPTAILGLETVDSQAFGNILAGQVAGSLGTMAETAAPAAPLPPLPIIAGDRQPGGKILPGAAPILPDAATLRLEAPVVPSLAAQVVPSIAAQVAPNIAAQVAPNIAAIPVAPAPVRLVTTPLTPRLTTLAPLTEVATPETDIAETDIPGPKQAEASPVHGLIKMLTAALKGQRPAAPQASEDARAQPEAASWETDVPAPAVATAAPVVAAADVTVPIPTAPFLPGPFPTAPIVATLPAVVADTRRASASNAAPASAAVAQTPTAAQRAEPAVTEPAQPVVAQFVAQPVQTQPVQTQPVQTQPAASHAGRAAPVETPAVPVLTVAATPTATATATPVLMPTTMPMPVVTLVSAPTLPVGQTVAARIEVASPAITDGAEGTADRPATAQPPLPGRVTTNEAPIAAARAALSVRTVLAERAAPDAAAALATPTTADSQPQTPAATPGAATPVATVSVAAAPTTTAPVTGAPVTTAPVVEMPRQDFAALVDRLVEARNASVSRSTHASLNHAEFGQVSLHFQQDGGNLTVGMSSADPEFARAAQAAQAAMPAERQNLGADTGTRGQAPNQAPNPSQLQSQAGGSASSSHLETAGRGTDGAGQGRGGQDRNSRGGTNTSNPSPRWADRDQSQTRGGIFA